MFRLSTCSSRTTLIYKQGITTRLLTVHSFSGHSKNQSCKNVNSSIFLSFLCFNPSNLKQPDASLISGIPSAVTETWTTWMLLKQWTAGIPGPSIHWKVTHTHTHMQLKTVEMTRLVTMMPPPPLLWTSWLKNMVMEFVHTTNTFISS